MNKEKSTIHSTGHYDKKKKRNKNNCSRNGFFDFDAES